MSQAKERPILFSGPMIRALLDGRKTATRRVVKPQFLRAPVDVVDGAPSWDHPATYAGEVMMNNERGKPCPYGKPGDRLWVREAWAADAQLDSIAPRDLGQHEPIYYPADSSVRQTECSIISQGKVRPSIHMPRCASRILLEITDVRVERLQDINEEQAEAEGIDGCIPSCPGPYDEDGNPECDCMNLSHQESFQVLWESTNGKKSWSANPWVWVVEFKRVQP